MYKRLVVELIGHKLYGDIAGKALILAEPCLVFVLVAVDGDEGSTLRALHPNSGHINY